VKLIILVIETIEVEEIFETKLQGYWQHLKTSNQIASGKISSQFVIPCMYV